MDKLHTEEVTELFEAILTLKDVEECYRFFEDVCTAKELLDLAQRLKTAKMLSAGSSYAEINRDTGSSTATISRVRRCLEYGEGGYRLVLDRVALRKGDGEEA